MIMTMIMIMTMTMIMTMIMIMTQTKIYNIPLFAKTVCESFLKHYE